MCVCPYLSFSKLDLRARRTVIAERVGCILENAPQEDVRNVTGLLAWSFVRVHSCMHVCPCVPVCACLCSVLCLMFIQLCSSVCFNLWIVKCHLSTVMCALMLNALLVSSDHLMYKYSTAEPLVRLLNNQTELKQTVLALNPQSK